MSTKIIMLMIARMERIAEAQTNPQLRELAFLTLGNLQGMLDAENSRKKVTV